jgi:small subunit ribosomal protein S13
MARIVGIDLPNSKRVEIGLTYIHGIGRTVSSKILKTTGVNPDTRVSDLTEEEISKIAAVIRSDYRVEGDLRREVTAGIRRLMDIGSYRGIRHKRSLPVRGQRTKTNARMRKGPRKLVGARKQKMVPKGQKK